jgi:uncharacterized cupin superfamily protein
MEELCSLNSGPPHHTHEQDEVLYIIECEVALIAGAEELTAKAGSLAYACAHNVSYQAARYFNGVGSLKSPS